MQPVVCVCVCSFSQSALVVRLFASNFHHKAELSRYACFAGEILRRVSLSAKTICITGLINAETVSAVFNSFRETFFRSFYQLWTTRIHLNRYESHFR